MLTATIKSSFALDSGRGGACLRQTGETLVAFIHCLHPPPKLPHGPKSEWRLLKRAVSLYNELEKSPARRRITAEVAHENHPNREIPS